MQLIADIFLSSGAFAAAAYCIVLSRRLQRFTQLESGMGGAIAVLSAQVDDMTRALERAQGLAKTSVGALDGLNGRAEAAAARLELLLATLHDLPEPGPANPAVASPQRKLRVLRSRSERATADQPALEAVR